MILCSKNDFIPYEVHPNAKHFSHHQEPIINRSKNHESLNDSLL